MLGLDGVYNTVTAAYTVTENGETLYAFVSRPYGYSNIPMAVYYVLNADGEIVMMNAKEFILEKDYFSNYTPRSAELQGRLRRHDRRDHDGRRSVHLRRNDDDERR